jgi:hypothetical protein
MPPTLSIGVEIYLIVTSITDAASQDPVKGIV